jgi:hypothetical protein
MTRPPVEELLRCPNAYLYRQDFFRLGLGRKSVDRIIEAIGRDEPGGGRPLVLVADWLEYRERFTYRDGRIRP